MIYFTLIVLCGLVCADNLQLANNGNINKLTSTNEDPCVRSKPEIVLLKHTMKGQLLSPTNDQMIRPTNRRAYFKDIFYNPTVDFKSVNAPRQTFQEDNKQLKQLKAMESENKMPTPSLTGNDNDSVIVNDYLEIPRLFKDFSDSSNDALAFRQQEIEADNIYDLKQSRNRLVNPVSSITDTRMMPNTVQCGDNINQDYITDTSRRFLSYDNNMPKLARTSDINKHTQTISTKLNKSTITNDSDVPPRRHSDDITVLNPDARYKPNDYASNRNALYNANEDTNPNLDKNLRREANVERSGSLSSVKLNDPTKGRGISNMNKSTLLLMNYDRVCYACSSANNPTCLSPDRRTTVKYCPKGINSCVTKTFRIENTLTLTRDCGKSCDGFEVRGLSLKYSSCSICHSDLCNSASNHIYSLTIILATLLGFVKSLI